MKNIINGNGIILLTGAGFTHNFGTPLAKELWSIILSYKSVQSNPKIKDLMLNDFDYESIYHIVMDDDFTESEKKAMNDATLFAYSHIDSIIRNWHFTNNAPCPVNIYEVQNLINLFSGTRSDKGFFLHSIKIYL